MASGPSKTMFPTPASGMPASQRCAADGYVCQLQSGPERARGRAGEQRTSAHRQDQGSLFLAWLCPFWRQCALVRHLPKAAVVAASATIRACLTVCSANDTSNRLALICGAMATYHAIGWKGECNGRFRITHRVDGGHALRARLHAARSEDRLRHCRRPRRNRTAELQRLRQAREDHRGHDWFVRHAYSLGAV